MAHNWTLELCFCPTCKRHHEGPVLHGQGTIKTRRVKRHGEWKHLPVSECLRCMTRGCTPGMAALMTSKYNRVMDILKPPCK